MGFFNSKDSKFYLGQYDLTSYLTDVDGLPGARRLVPVTAMGDSGVKSIPSLQEGDVSIAGFFNDDAAGTEVSLGTLRTDANGEPASHWPKGDAFGVAGYAVEISHVREAVFPSSVGNAVLARANLAKHGVAERIISLAAKATVTATTTGTSYDDGASSSNGLAWYYHIFANSATGGNAQWVLSIESDADDTPPFTEEDSVTLASGTVGGARRLVTGTIERYRRIVMTLDATSGSITFVAGFIEL